MRTNKTFQSFTFGESEVLKPREKPDKISKVFDNDIAPGKRQMQTHRPSDQPLDSFYLINSERETKVHVKQPQPPKEHFYKCETEIRQMSGRDKKLLDNRSSIFYQGVYKTPEKNSAVQQEISLNNRTWSDVHVGKTPSAVNENVKFDQSYAKKQKIKEQGSQIGSQTQRSVRCSAPNKELEAINQPNKIIKSQNQQFSDIFGQELGYKNKEKPQVGRAVSVSMQWDRFDSVLNGKEFSGMTQVIIRYHQGSRVHTHQEGQRSHMDTHQYVNTQKQESLSKNVFDCKQSYEMIKGQYKQNYNGFKNFQQFGEEMKIQSNKQQYHGIYAWKKNYKR